MKNFNEDEISSMEDFCRQKGMIFQPINQYNLLLPKHQDYAFHRPPKCKECNRIRLLCDGTLKPCLHSDIEIPVDFNNIEKSLIQTIQSKPEEGSVCYDRQMVQIGG
jgi:cyclic pyranopterin phosphate synthase